MRKEADSHGQAQMRPLYETLSQVLRVQFHYSNLIKLSFYGWYKYNTSGIAVWPCISLLQFGITIYDAADSVVGGVGVVSESAYK